LHAYRIYLALLEFILGLRVAVRLDDTRHFAVVPSAIVKYIYDFMCVIYCFRYNGKNKSFD